MSGVSSNWASSTCSAVLVAFQRLYDSINLISLYIIYIYILYYDYLTLYGEQVFVKVSEYGGTILNTSKRMGIPLLLGRRFGWIRFPPKNPPCGIGIINHPGYMESDTYISSKVLSLELTWKWKNYRISWSSKRPLSVHNHVSSECKSGSGTWQSFVFQPTRDFRCSTDL